MKSQQSATDRPSIGPVEMVVLQGTPFCNLNCSYCYLSEASRRNKATMDMPTIRTVFDKLFWSRYVDAALNVSWHSGEPLVLKPAYYRDAMNVILEIAEQTRSGDFDVRFDIQSNGTLINDEWCRLFTDFGDRFAIGISCDGPAFLHDRQRRGWSGKPTHHLTEAGMKRLCDNGITFDVTAVVSPESLDYPVEFIEYFADYSGNIREFHFNLHDEFFIDRNDAGKIERYAKKYEAFLRALLARIGEDHEGRLPRIRNFSSFYSMLFVREGERPSYDARSMSRPFKTLSIETNGDVTTFYAGLTLDECRDLKDLYGDGKGFVIGST